MTRDEIIEIVAKGINRAKIDRGVYVKPWHLAGEDEKVRCRLDATPGVDDLISSGVITVDEPA